MRSVAHWKLADFNIITYIARFMTKIRSIVINENVLTSYTRHKQELCHVVVNASDQQCKKYILLYKDDG